MSHRPAKEDGSTTLRFLGFLIVVMGVPAGALWILLEVMT